MKKIVLLAMLLVSTTAFADKIVLTENNSVAFNEKVTSEFVSKKILEVMTKSLKTKKLYLVMDTPGGSVGAGLQFIDIVKALDIEVHTITLFAASMGYQIVQELGTRYITESGILMSHRGAVSGMSGQIPGELNSRVSFIHTMLNKMSERASKRLGISKKKYDSLIFNELWSFGKNAIDTNQADKVAQVTCSKELLKGTYKKKFFTFMGSLEVTFSKCPLITAPVGVNFGKGIKNENKAKLIKYFSTKKRRAFLTF